MQPRVPLAPAQRATDLWADLPKVLDLAKRRSQKGEDPAWRRLERLREEEDRQRERQESGGHADRRVRGQRLVRDRGDQQQPDGEVHEERVKLAGDQGAILPVGTEYGSATITAERTAGSGSTASTSTSLTAMPCPCRGPRRRSLAVRLFG